jgi:putative transcriptional regulator
VSDDPSEGPTTSSLAQHLLCAVPQLLDPNFVRSVVLLIDHTPEGAFGIILNHPLPTPMGEFAAAIGLRWDGPAERPVRLGGPVEPVRGFLLHDQPGWDPLADAVAPGAYLTTSLEGVHSAGDGGFGGGDANFLVFVGYAGWGPGQLEAELDESSWIVESGAGSGLFPEPDDDLWGAVLRDKGGLYRVVALMPEDPSLN